MSTSFLMFNATAIIGQVLQLSPRWSMVYFDLCVHRTVSVRKTIRGILTVGTVPYSIAQFCVSCVLLVQKRASVDEITAIIGMLTLLVLLLSNLSAWVKMLALH